VTQLSVVSTQIYAGSFGVAVLTFDLLSLSDFCNEDEDENDTSVEFQIASEFKVGSEVTEEPTTAPSKAPTKEPTPSPTKEPCSWADQFEKDKSGCPIVNLDFSTLDPGEYITGQLADTYGVTIKARGKKKGGYTPGGAARVFDTNYPGDGRNGIGDPDLGSPNESCGGPGKGYGGEMGSQYENCIPLNNVLVIQDRDQAQWSDNCGGGYIEFRFTDKVFIKELALLDIEDRQGAEATIKVHHKSMPAIVEDALPT
jgi:hypothetical protein